MKGGYPMKKAELVKYLKEHGCKKIGEGGKHETWLNTANNIQFPISRAPGDVPKPVFHRILREAGLK